MVEVPRERVPEDPGEFLAECKKTSRKKCSPALAPGAALSVDFVGVLV